MSVLDVRALVALLLAAGCAVSPVMSPAPSSVAPSTPAATPKPARCTAVVTPTGVLPDERCTPGAVASSDPAEVCRAGYAAAHRRVTAAVRRKVLAAYGNPPPPYELDHLISLELGGDNSAANLWPEPGSVPNSKDKTEAALHVAVCRRGVELATAQRAIATDWTTAVEAIR